MSPVIAENEIVAGYSPYTKTPLAHAAKADGMFLLSLCGRSGVMFFIQRQFDPEASHHGEYRTCKKCARRLP